MDVAGIYRFGNCVVDANRREIALGGSFIGVQPKALDLLVYLIEHRDRAVSKDELQDNIWPRTIVTETSLTRCIMKARRAVNDDPQDPQIIKTVRGHGYRFVAQLEEDPAIEPPVPQPGRPSVAILPFRDLSPAQDQQYFCDGMAEELIDSLARLQGVDVAGRSSTFGLKEVDATTVGKTLGVSYVLEGSLQKQGDEMGLRLNLVDTRSGFQVWSEKYRRTLDDVFAVQEDVAANVVRSIAPQLRIDELHAVSATRNFASYDYFLKGRQYTHWFSKRGHLLAIEMFEKALDAEADYLPARTGIAISHALIFQWFEQDPAHKEAAEEHSRIAIERSPESPQAFLARGVAKSVAHDYAAAEEAFAIATSLDPQLYEAYYLHGRVCVGQGKNAQAVELFRRGAELRSDEHQCRYLAAQCYDSLGLHKKKVEWAGYSWDVIESLLELNPDNNRALYHGAGALQYLGEGAAGIKLTDRSLELQPDDPITIYAAACQYAKEGDFDRAFELLDQLIVSGSFWYEWMQHDPTVQSLRDDPRFEAVMERIRKDG